MEINNQILTLNGKYFHQFKKHELQKMNVRFLALIDRRIYMSKIRYNLLFESSIPIQFSAYSLEIEQQAIKIDFPQR